MGSLNSVISDPEPYVAPTAPAAPKIAEDDWAKLGKSKKYKEVNDYLEARKEFYRRFTPGGTAIETLSESDRLHAWGQAMCVIKEIEGFQATIATHTT